MPRKQKKIEIIYEDKHLLVMDKPAGLLVQGDETGDECLLDIGKDYIKEKYNKPGKVYLGLPHRLDRPVSGIVVLAKTSKALSRLTGQFKSRTVEKIYRAIVEEPPEKKQAELRQFISWNDKTRRATLYHRPGVNTRTADLDYKILGKKHNATEVEIKLLTGRQHQIRAQLAFLGCHILGDKKYGAKNKYPKKGIALQAYKISLDHPTTKKRLVFRIEY